MRWRFGAAKRWLACIRCQTVRLALTAPVWGVGLALAALAMLFRQNAAAWAMAILWLAALALTLLAAVSAPDALASVPVAETAVFGVFAFAQARGGAEIALRVAFGLMLVLFGAIHLTPPRGHRFAYSRVDTATAVLALAHRLAECLAGLACIAGRGVRIGAGAIALMYASWLPIVHALRLAEDLTSTFEWTFALTALALAGIAMHVAAEGYARNRANA